MRQHSFGGDAATNANGPSDARLVRAGGENQSLVVIASEPFRQDDSQCLVFHEKRDSGTSAGLRADQGQTT